MRRVNLLEKTLMLGGIGGRRRRGRQRMRWLDGELTATATAKSLQSCPTLCDPIDGSPPGSPIPGSRVPIPFRTSRRNVGLLLRRCRGQGPHLGMTGEPRGVSRVVAGYSSFDGEYSLPHVLGQGSPIIHSSCEGELGITLESLQVISKLCLRK